MSAHISRAHDAMQMDYKDHEALFQTNYFGVVSACAGPRPSYLSLP